MKGVALLIAAVISTQPPAAAREFTDAAQRFIALQLRIAHGAAITCGFVLDADRFKKRLVEDDVSYADLFSSQYTPQEIEQIAEDAAASQTAKPGGAYCEQAWKDYGPDAYPGDDVFYKCRTSKGCD